MHNNRILALALLLGLVLAVPALAAAGGADDPLISRSYAETAFRADADAALEAVAARAVAARAAVGSTEGLRVLTLAPGEGVTLGDGQQLVLLSGAVELTIERGALVNSTLGRDSVGGRARTGCRYVAWDGAEVAAVALEQASVAVSPRAVLLIPDVPQPTETPQPTESPRPTESPQPTEPPAPTESPQPTESPRPTDALPFTDVKESDWFYADVAGAWRRGLVNGMDAVTYAPRENMTLAQAVKLCACMHQLYHDGAVTLVNADGGDPWYYTYAGYALDKGILTEMPMSGWNDPVNRAAFVRLFFRALPEEAYTPINTIMDGAIPDVATDAEIAQEVYTFYTAGILTGYAEGDGRMAHEFGPATPITRAEVATIMNRMFDPEARVRFDMM